MKKIFCILLGLMLFFSVTVVSAESVEKVYLGDLIKDKANWEGIGMGAENWKFDGSTLSLLPSDIKSAGYMAKKYKNIELNFDVTVSWPEDAGDWGSIITVRDFNPGVPVWEGIKAHAYGILFGENNVKLCKWLNGGAPIDLAMKDNLSMNGKRHTFKWTVKDVDGGVSHVIIMDGKEIINVVDKKKPIFEEGGIMVMNHGPRSAVYTSTKEAQSAGSNTNTQAGTSNPKTGDAGLLAYAVLSAGSLFVIRKFLKNRDKN